MKPVHSQFLGPIDRLSAAMRTLAVAMAVALVVLVGAVPAPAEEISGSRIQNIWGNETETDGTVGGRFNGAGPVGVAVNDGTGDVYVADTGNHRIQQFTSSGAFIRSWGFDVTLPAASPASSASFEVCIVVADCKAGVASVSPVNGLGGQFSSPAGVAVDQVTGRVFVSDVGFNRVQVFSATGTFLLAFGQDVIQAGKPNDNGTGFEVCDTTAASPNTAADCKAGTQGASGVAGNGGVLNAPGNLSVAPAGAPNAGNVLVADPARMRVQEFTSGGAFVRAFGGGVVDGGAAGTGTVSTASKTITAVATTSGAFVPGQRISGAGLPADAVIASVAGTSITYAGSTNPTVAGTGVALTVAVGAGNSPSNETQTVSFGSTVGGGDLALTVTPPSPPTTPATAQVPYSSTGAQVQALLEALSSVGAGNVSVTGPAGGPWSVEFKGTRYSDTDMPQMTTAATNLSWAVGSQITCTGGPTGGAGATQVAYQWVINGAPATGAGATSATYTIAASDDGKVIQCRVIATHTAGAAPTGAMRLFAPRRVGVVSGPAPGPPANIPAPAAPVGGFVAGSQLNCTTGSWTNGPTFTYRWFRNGIAIAGATTNQYTLQASDLATAAAFQCEVTGTNANGAASRDSASISTAAPAPAPSPAPPVATTAIPALTASVVTNAPGAGAFETCVAIDACLAGTAGTGNGQFATGAVREVAQDADGTVYTVERAGNLRVQRFTASGALLTAQGTFACPMLCGTGVDDMTTGVAVDGDGDVYVRRRFPAGAGDPPAVLPITGSQIAVTNQERVLKVDPSTGQVLETFLVNPGSMRWRAPGHQATAIHSKTGQFHNGLTGLAVASSGTPLYVVANTATDPGQTRSRVYRLGDVAGIDVELSSANVKASSATLEATITPADTPLDTHYRFEYSRAGFDDWSQFQVPPPPDRFSLGVNLGNGSAGGESSACSPASPAAVCHVSQEVDGLVAGRAYEFRVVAVTDYSGLVYVSDPQPLAPQAAPPTVSTGPAVWSGPPSAQPSLIFTGRVNPQGAPTSYRFEYVTEAQFQASGFDDAASAPADGGSAGLGGVAVDVTAVAVGVDPSSTYRYRIVATNATGSTVGGEGIIEPGGESDRYLELVSDGDSQGVGVSQIKLAISDDGLRAQFVAIAFGEQPSSPYIVNPQIARRTSDGWAVTSVVPDPDGVRGRDESGWGDAGVTRRLWTRTSSSSAVSQRLEFSDGDGHYTPVEPELTPLDRIGNPDYSIVGGSNDLSTAFFKVNAPTSSGVLQGVTFSADEPMLVASFTNPFSNLYSITGAGTETSALHVVNRGVGGAVIGGPCGARLGAARTPQDPGTSDGGDATRAVSADGDIAYFSARPDASGATCDSSLPVRVYKRVGNASTVAVSQSQCTRGVGDPGGVCNPVEGSDFFSGASADGSKVFFTTNRQLANSDTDALGGFGLSGCAGFSVEQGGCDLYLYDASPPAGQPSLVQVSAGEEVPGANPGDPVAHAVGSGAGVRGVVDVAMDGSRVYFVATGRLTGDAVAGANNLYVYRRDAAEPTGRIAFVTALSSVEVGASLEPGDDALWARLSPGEGKASYALPYYDGLGAGRGDGDGHLLVFSSNAALTADDTDAFKDLYRYDDLAGELMCVSCAGDGAFHARLLTRQTATADPDAVQRQRVASEDGSLIVFSTVERLLADQDTNSAPDAYLWREGEGLSLISGATGDRGLSTVSGNLGQNDVGPVISPDGGSVFFLTRATLLPQDANSGGPDWYAARVGGGFPQTADAAVCDILAGACHGGGSPAVSSDTKTSSPSGSDNAAAEARKTLSVSGLSVKARKRAARTGRLTLSVRTSSPGRVSLTVRAKLGKRTSRVGRASKRIGKAGSAKMTVRLSSAARKRLHAGKRLRLSVEVSQPGARVRTRSILLPGVPS